MTMYNEKCSGKGLLSLFRNDDGNVLVLFAAAAVPLVLTIGAGVDISRTYMVQTRLQQACDAGVLAGRKAVGQLGTYTDSAKARATELFDANISSDYQQSYDVDFQTTSGNLGSTVDGVATARMPMSIMRLVGKQYSDIHVECTASMEVSNADITMVLDTTGSMACPENYNTTQCTTYNAANGTVEGVGGTTSRLSALRTAMGNFYDTLEDAVDGSTARVRYSFVPYSMTVNVGSLLRAKSVKFIDTKHTYQSREWVVKGCNANGTIKTNNGPGGVNCYIYRPVDYNLGGYIQGNSPYNMGANGTAENYQWRGCVEEVATVTAAWPTFSAGTGWTPAGMKDMDIDYVPASSDEGWRPYFPEISWGRKTLAATANPIDTWKPQTACPAESMFLAEITKQQITDYAASLIPTGGTYHNVGMAWGGRLSSPDGVIADIVNDPAPNGGAVSRHLIFMTDGQMDVGNSVYDSWGIEWLDRRVSGGPLYNWQHNRRFAELCKAVKAKGIRIWVIAFGTSMNGTLLACASEGSAFTSANANQLNSAFQQIADEVGALRITR